jgi:sporulation protein YlmC with PRC-barrel domain
MSQLNVFSSSPQKASNIIGSKVVNPTGDTLGDIKEIVIDPRSGKVAYAAIPFGSFEFNVTKNEYVLNVSKERMESAPGFAADKWPLMSDEKWNRDTHKYFERSPYWE